MATRYQKFIGGLLGEDVEGMSEEERKQLSRQGTTSAILGMLGGKGLLGGLGAYGEQREEKRKKAKEEEQAAIQRQLQVAIGSQLGEGQGMSPNLMNILSTPEGAAAVEANPMLKKAIEDRLGTQVVGGSVYDRATGQFIQPPKEVKPRLPVREVDSGREKIVYFDDGTVERIPKTLAPGAGGADAGGKAVKPSEGQIRSSLLAKGMRDAEQELFNLSPSSVIGRGSGFVPEAFKSSDRKRYESAAKRWAANLLYIKSGAQAGQDEINSTWQQFFPVPGDSKEEIAQKNRARIQELEAVSGMLGTVGFKPEEFQPRFVKEKPPEVPLDDWMLMTPKDRADFLKAGKGK